MVRRLAPVGRSQGRGEDQGRDTNPSHYHVAEFLQTVRQDRRYDRYGDDRGERISSKIYKLDVVAIPTNRGMKRIEYADTIYLTEKEKFEAVAEDVERTNKCDLLTARRQRSHGADYQGKRLRADHQTQWHHRRTQNFHERGEGAPSARSTSIDWYRIDRKERTAVQKAGNARNPRKCLRTPSTTVVRLRSLLKPVAWGQLPSLPTWLVVVQTQHRAP